MGTVRTTTPGGILFLFDSPHSLTVSSDGVLLPRLDVLLLLPSSRRLFCLYLVLLFRGASEGAIGLVLISGSWLRSAFVIVSVLDCYVSLSNVVEASYAVELSMW